MNEAGFNGFAGGYASAVQMIKRVNRAINNEDEMDGLAAFEAINRGGKKRLEKFLLNIARE